MLRFYLDDLKKYEVASITEDLDDKEKAKVTHFIAQIDSIHDQYKASCGTKVLL
jgi:hypothetical protein